MSKSYAEVLTEDRRLVLLKLLAESTGYKATGYVLQPALESLGHVASMDAIRTDLAWLAEQGLVRLEEVGGVVIATITARGIDVGAGRATVPGVKKPLPG
jgi:Fe2+ or Zn2+ uptake regulation protein